MFVKWGRYILIFDNVCLGFGNLYVYVFRLGYRFCVVDVGDMRINLKVGM